MSKVNSEQNVNAEILGDDVLKEIAAGMSEQQAKIVATMFVDLNLATEDGLSLEKGVSREEATEKFAAAFQTLARNGTAGGS